MNLIFDFERGLKILGIKLNGQHRISKDKGYCVFQERNTEREGNAVNSLKYTYATGKTGVVTAGPRPSLKFFLCCAAVSFIVGSAPGDGNFRAKYNQWLMLNGPKHQVTNTNSCEVLKVLFVGIASHTSLYIVDSLH